MDLTRVRDNLNKLYEAERNYYRLSESHCRIGEPNWECVMKALDEGKEAYHNLVNLGIDKDDLFNFKADAAATVKPSVRSAEKTDNSSNNEIDNEFEL